MKKLVPVLFITAATLFNIGCAGVGSSDYEDGFVPLFDGKSLDGWIAARSAGEGDWGAFSVNEEEQAIQVYAGQQAGSEQVTDALNTVGEYSHYILKLEYKWLENRYAPRAEADRDAGLLYHVHGDLTKVWPLSMEMQIGESPGDIDAFRDRYHTGDLFVLGRYLRAKTHRNGAWYDPESPLTDGKAARTYLGQEKPKGEWNEMEIRVQGAEKATFIFNGEIVLELYDMHTVSGENGEIKTPLTKGHIGLQAEWADLMYRNIRIKEL